ncbi:MAG: polyphosphate polymerase domain-containing protein [Defluviitaleaceae bacterium]|nr:polyphosphate polymerase domain-containing protein [Defluviitaleaceae bacterium]
MRFRYENKYIVTEEVAAILKARIEQTMKPDENGGSYVIHNMYLDDKYDSAYHGRVLGRNVRDKYRIRHYNNDLSFIRLERKHKEGVYVWKDTVPISEEQYKMIRAGDMDFILKEEAPLFKTLAMLHRLKGGMRPTCLYSYKRDAYVYKPGNVRFTFDRPPFQTDDGLPPLPIQQQPHIMNFGKPDYWPILLEVKYNRFLPEIMRRMLHGLPLFYTSISKYGMARERGVLPYDEC